MARKILIVEDEYSQLSLLSDVFKASGFSVLTARNGQEGLDVAESEEPNLILLDIVMPVMDGITMLGHIRRNDDWGKEVPVLVITNLTTSDQLLHYNHTPEECLLKTDCSVYDILHRAKQILGNTGTCYA